MHGEVVWARRGDREAYRPIKSSLTEGCEPIAVAKALLARCPVALASPLLYGADLDALRGGAPQAPLLGRLAGALAGVEVWWDAAFADADAARALDAQAGAPPNWRPVFGSESLADETALRALAGDPRAILSLDRRDDRLVDRAGCWTHPEAWPDTVIVMTLERVGSAAGPDLATLARVRRQAGGQRRVFGAGGLRDAADAAAAAAAGADGWLVASALHAGTLIPG